MLFRKNTQHIKWQQLNFTDIIKTILFTNRSRIQAFDWYQYQ